MTQKILASSFPWTPSRGAEASTQMQGDGGAIAELMTEVVSDFALCPLRNSLRPVRNSGARPVLDVSPAAIPISITGNSRSASQVHGGLAYIFP